MHANWHKAFAKLLLHFKHTSLDTLMTLVQSSRTNKEAKIILSETMPRWILWAKEQQHEYQDPGFYDFNVVFNHCIFYFCNDCIKTGVPVPVKVSSEHESFPHYLIFMCTTTYYCFIQPMKWLFLTLMFQKGGKYVDSKTIWHCRPGHVPAHGRLVRVQEGN